MSKARAALIAIALVTGFAGLTVAGSETGAMIAPNTPEAAKVLAQLRQAEHLDKLNAQGYSSIDIDRGTFYSFKARQAEEIIKRLKNGQSVLREDVDWALDNSQISQY
jgi:hypothetical protein